MQRYSRALTPREIADLPDREIDFTDIPELDRTFWQEAHIVEPASAKRQITLRLDTDVVEWFRASGRGYQTRMNAVLRAYMKAHRVGDRS